MKMPFMSMPHEIDYSVHDVASNLCIDIGVAGVSHTNEWEFINRNTAGIRGDMPNAVRVMGKTCQDLGYTEKKVCMTCPSKTHYIEKVFIDEVHGATIYHHYWQRPTHATTIRGAAVLILL